MLMDKKALLETLHLVAGFDPTASPFIAINLAPQPQVYRSSSFGFVSSKSMLIGKDSVFVSHGHIYDCLRAMPEDKVELSLGDGGVLVLRSVESAFTSELRVRTVPVEDSCLKSHDIGAVGLSLRPEAFKGFNAKPFAVASPPLLQDGRILLSTAPGVVMWQGPDALRAAKLHPRDGFLRFIGGGADEVFVTDKGYWGASMGPLVAFVSGHSLSPHLHQVYSVPGEAFAEFPAARLMEVLSAAASLCDPSRKVVFDPKRGVVAWNQYGNPQEFSLGAPQDGWEPFGIQWQAAKLVHDALGQSGEALVTLERVAAGNLPTVRFRRGNWDANVKVF